MRRLVRKTITPVAAMPVAGGSEATDDERALETEDGVGLDLAEVYCDPPPLKVRFDSVPINCLR